MLGDLFQLVVYEDIEPELRERVEDVIFNRRADATERLVEYAERVRGEGTKRAGLALNFCRTKETSRWRG